MINEDFTLDFNVDHNIRKILENVPGIGKNTRRYTVKAAMTKDSVEEIERTHGIDMGVQVKNTLCQEVVMMLQKTVYNELRKIEPTKITMDELKVLMSKEKVVVTNSAIAAKLMDDERYIANYKSNAAYNGMSSVGWYNYGDKNCQIYVNALLPFSDSRVFVVNDNVVNMLTASEGLITRDQNNYTVMIEGEYTVTVSENNKHYEVVGEDGFLL
jgi:hypothetical protein